MPNIVPAAAEGMPEINRRRLLGGMVAASTASAVAGSSVAIAATYEKPLAELIAAHKQALEASELAWAVLDDIDEANDIPVPKVQYGRMLLGKNDDGSDRFEPLYAYDDETIDQIRNKSLNTRLSLWGRDESSRQTILGQHDKRTSQLKRELREKQEERAAAELACGYTAALTAARAASDVADDRLDAILSYPIRDLETLRTVVAHMLEGLDSGQQGFCNDMFIGSARSLAVQS
ncbi:MAG: hypothetical protein R3D70_14100 [Rhizobiaceae bacterium]